MKANIEHRWSGWPGAWCLDCGISDPYEDCLASHDVLDFVCKKCSEHWPQGECLLGGPHDLAEISCPEHLLTECIEPNSHNHDPYWKRYETNN